MLNALAAKANANKVYAAASKLINCQRETHLSANCFWPKREAAEEATEKNAKGKEILVTGVTGDG